jgi:DeoR family glycerol-3-phosphate regulon repressor
LRECEALLASLSEFEHDCIVCAAGPGPQEIAMGPARRHEAIIDIVRREGFADIEAMAARLGVTPQTIRRDVKQLAGRGVVRRYHGGAALLTSSENIDYATRRILNLPEKRRIATAVAAHIPDQASLFINLGTTTEEVARVLADRGGLRVITNNLNAIPAAR